ncbi:serpin family protein [Streptomyces sp. BK205]|uniref:serpin family protein n=1 Tax=Streptomyces sp. BK205 TaxID=2512164 RepID=UPI00104DB38C|nr:serpin family protein [Streptomyces sp. BK205]
MRGTGGGGMAITGTTTRAVNGLAVRWAETRESRTAGGAASPADEGTVFSPVGVWPLLALLADGAHGAARAELAEAVGLPAEECATAARELLRGLATVRGLESALGLWTAPTVEVREPWAAGLPADAHGRLSGDPAVDQLELDTWAAKRTNGLIERMPIEVREDTQLVLASALALQTTWLRPFQEVPWAPTTGPWADRVLRGLSRTSELLDRVGVAETPDGHVTELRALGDTAVDVHLLLGEEHMTAGQVLRAGVGLLADRRRVVSGFRLPYGEPGPGLRVHRSPSTRPLPPLLTAETVAFDLQAQHDLLGLHQLFGLTTARDTREGHFPGISAAPLAIGSAQQSTMAKFAAEGFRSAAVTALGAVGSAPPKPRWITTEVRAVFDRPFAFLAVHRHSRLVLTAGWVTDPQPYG